MLAGVLVDILVAIAEVQLAAAISALLSCQPDVYVLRFSGALSFPKIMRELDCFV